MQIIFRILKQIFSQYPKLVALGYFSVIGASFSAMVIPWLIGASVNRILVSEGSKVTDLYWVCFILFLTGLSRGLFSFGQTYIGELVAQKWAYDLRSMYFDKLQHLSFSFHDLETTGSLMSRATIDVEGVRMFVNMGAIRTGFVIVMIMGIGGAMIATDFKLSFVSLAFLPFLSWRAVSTSRRLRRGWLIIQTLAARMNTVLQENLNGMRVVKSFSAEEFEKDRFSFASESVATETRKTQILWAGNFSVMNFLFFLSLGAILWVGGRDILSGIVIQNGQTTYTNLNPGELTSFIFYMGMLQMPIRMIGWMVNSFSRAASCGQRLFAVLDQIPVIDDAADAYILDTPKGRIQFSGVYFRYRENGDWNIENLDLTIEAGQHIGIIGTHGSGKSTIAHLIPRFYDISRGSISIDGHDVREVTLKSLRDSVSIVQQDVFVHAMSIYKNISYGFPGASMEKVMAAAKTAQVHDFILTLPDGYETVIGERGAGLSGGQKQRLSLARTILRETPIVIFDDSTSSVDVDTENELIEAIRRNISGKTIITISHRLTAVRNADFIIVLSHGKIVQKGSHFELVDLPGEYRDLYLLQTNSVT